MADDSEKPVRWIEAGLCLSLAHPYALWREAPWLRLVTTDSDEPGRVQAYRLVEAPHVGRIEQAVQQWLDTDELPTLEPPASHLLSLRFETVGSLLATFDGILQPPLESQIGELYSRFLLDWWRQHGALYAVGYSCADYDFEG